MIVAAALGTGIAVGWVVWLLLRDVFSGESFARKNFRGAKIATAVGLVLPITVAVVEAGRVIIARLGQGQPATTLGRVATLVLVFGFGLLGLVDDLAGGNDRGFRGHLMALVKGRLTTGALKLFGGAFVAVAAAALVAGPGWGSLLLDAAVIALAANLGNLFDRAPGRTTKMATLAMAALAAATLMPPSLAGPAVVLGAAVALLGAELREEAMLGDTGANVVGAVAGLAVVLTLSTVPRVIVAASLLALNLISEVMSFGTVIDRVPPLRVFDRLGRRPA
ncbi:MAG: hypothetical protein ACR2H3_05180 [Acidimicrobiales bacterium]